MASQSGKTDFAINVFCERIQNDPVPVIYVGPSRHFVERKFEPRFEAAVDSAATLATMRDRVRRQSKTQKHINGVEISFVWAGSASAIAGQPAGLVIIDELDRMDVDVEGEGDVVELAAARHRTYTDGKVGVFSTPVSGRVEIERHPITGLEHWAMSDQKLLQSPGWLLWQRGTRHEWMWPCPHCEVMFAPRLRHLQVPDMPSGEFTDDNVFLACPHCGGAVYERDRTALNANGAAISPGQTTNADGDVQGDGVKSNWFTLWVSGMCSPWLSWTKAAQQYADAERFGSDESIQSVVNTTFGECYAVTGDAPQWEAVSKLRGTYSLGEIPAGVQELTMGVDVQQDRLYFVVRGWSVRQNLASWLLDFGTIEGATNEPDVWKALEQFKRKRYGNLHIKRCFVDQKYRTQYVFAFCHAHRNWAFPSAGVMPRTERTEHKEPLRTSTVDVNAQGKVMRGGASIKRWTVNADFFKRWVHDRLQRGVRGEFSLPVDVTDDYCQQLVAEARVVKPSGKIEWVAMQRDNHYLDCEQLAVACAYSLRLQHYAQPPPAAPPDTPNAAPPEAPKPTPPPTRPLIRVEDPNWITTW